MVKSRLSALLGLCLRIVTALAGNITIPQDIATPPPGTPVALIECTAVASDSATTDETRAAPDRAAPARSIDAYESLQKLPWTSLSKQKMRQGCPRHTHCVTSNIGCAACRPDSASRSSDRNTGWT
jgi:hypothetical protein